MKQSFKHGVVSRVYYASKCIIRRYYIGGLVLALMVLPGCGGNILDWGKKTFEQGGKYQEHEEIISRYMRTVKIYDMWETLAIFDVLFLSDEVRKAYTQLHAKMFGKTKESQAVFLRRQLKANMQHIVFYVLAGKNISLSKRPIVWALYLDIDGQRYKPVEVKQIDVPVQYRMFFDKRFSNHKLAYEIKFDRINSEECDVLDLASTHEM